MPKETNVQDGPLALPGINNLTYVEGMLEDFLRDPTSVPPDWQRYLAAETNGDSPPSAPATVPSFRRFSIFNPPASAEAGRIGRLSPPGDAAFQDRVYLLIRLYRVRGHRIARVDPLGMPQLVPPELQPEFFGFTAADMERPVHSETFQYDGELTLGG